MDSVAAISRVAEQTTKIVDGIRPDQLTLPTPCTEWTVRDVINHITIGGIMFATCVEQGSMSDEATGALMSGDNLGGDYRGAFKTAAGMALAAIGTPGASEKMVRLPFGEMPAGMAVNIAVFDLMTHCADLAYATGQHIQDEDLLRTALSVGQEMAGSLREAGLMAPAQPVSESAPLMEQLLAFAGRQV